MEDKKRNNKKIIMIALLVIGIISLTVGVTYAFFNYTRTGEANTISVGRIYFHTDQNSTINLTNVFPVSSNSVVSNSNNTVTVDIEGDTTYTGGIEYLVTIEDMNNIVNGKEVPISFKVTQNNLGTSSNTYWESRGGNAPIFELTEEGIASNGKYVMVGYIPAGSTGVDGSISITAYLDTTEVAVTDTIENGNIVVPGYDNGTNDDWIDGRVAITADEWNSFATTPLSFKVRVEANEGIWVEEPNKRIESCPDCKFMYYVADSSDITTVKWTAWNNQGQTPTQITSGLYDNYEELIATTGKSYFLGVKLNNNNEVTNAYACGVKDGTPFCIEGTSDGSKYTTNFSLVNGANLWNNTCTVESDYTECGPWDNSGSLSAHATSNGYVDAGVGFDDICAVTPDGFFGCIESEADEPDPSEPSNGTIESCPDCKFTYFVAESVDESTWKWTTWNTGGYDETNDEPYALTPTQITSGLYDNYEELIATTGKNYFLGVKLNNNNEVTNAYACGVKDNEPFCIEGTADGSKYVDNQTLLQGENLWNNTCTVDGDLTSGFTQCGQWDNTGSLSPFADSDGRVDVGVGGEDLCLVGPNGGFGCYEAVEPGPSEPGVEWPGGFVLGE